MDIITNKIIAASIVVLSYVATSLALVFKKYKKYSVHIFFFLWIITGIFIKFTLPDIHILLAFKITETISALGLAYKSLECLILAPYRILIPRKVCLIFLTILTIGSYLAATIILHAQTSAINQALVIISKIHVLAITTVITSVVGNVIINTLTKKNT